MKPGIATAATLIVGLVTGFVAGRASVSRGALAAPDAARLSGPGAHADGATPAAAAERVHGAGIEAPATQRVVAPASSDAIAATPEGVAAGSVGPATAPASATVESPPELTLRERLLAASEVERAQMLGALVAELRGAEPESRAQQLHELFKADGWFNDHPGPALDDASWRLAADTLRELPDGGARDELLQTLGQQLARVRGTNAMSTLVSLSTLTLADEAARIAGRASDPDAAAVAQMRQLLADSAADGTLDEESALDAAFGIGGASASIDDQRTLIRLASEGRMPRIRLSGYFALATTPPSAEVDAFLVHDASSAGSSWKTRAMAWQALVRRGREELLPARVVQEILVEWERSGSTDLEQLFNE